MSICLEKFLPNNPRMDGRSPNNPNPNPTRFRTLQITLVSATKLQGRKLPHLHLKKMKVYAEVSLITGDSPITKKKAEGHVDNVVDVDGETMWNLNLKVEPMTLPLTTPNQTSPQLIVKLSRRSMGYHRYIGHVDICVNTLLQNVSQNDESTFDIVKDTPNGKLKISYSLRETNQEQRPTHI